MLIDALELLSDGQPLVARLKRDLGLQCELTACGGRKRGGSGFPLCPAWTLAHWLPPQLEQREEFSQEKRSRWLEAIRGALKREKAQTAPAVLPHQ